MKDTNYILQRIKQLVLEREPSAKIYLYDLELEIGEVISPTLLMPIPLAPIN